MFPSAVRAESPSGSMQLLGGGVTHGGAPGADLLLTFYSDPKVFMKLSYRGSYLSSVRDARSERRLGNRIALLDEL